MPSAVILGAGFSSVAGLPPVSRLFDEEVVTTSAAARRRFEAIWAQWEKWRMARPDAGPEQYLEAVYEGTLPGVRWEWAVELVSAVLATPRRRDWPLASNPRYAGRLTVPVREPAHTHFWDFIVAHTTIGLVVTTNYDLLIERGLRHRPMARGRPGIYYGGLDTPQVLRGLAQPFSTQKSDRFVTLTGRIPLFKLHGSLNWSFERGEMVMYQDARAAFRRGGEAAIVPPVTEKTIPEWLRPIWQGAEQRMAGSEPWIVCGYSLPAYDHALHALFERAGKNVRTLYLLDPASETIVARWRTVAPRAKIKCLPGIPEALAHNFLTGQA